MIAYHSSNKKFDKFSLEQANTQNHKENFKALWFSTDREYIKQFGKIIYKVNIDTKNFLRESQYNKIDKLVHEFDSNCDDGIGILETKRGQEFADFLVSKGYDGYIFPQNEGKTIICFNPNVINILSSIDESLNEKLEKLQDGIWATKYSSDIINWMKNKPKQYRVIYDKSINYYFVCDAFNYIHQDMIEEAYYQGFYPDMLSASDARDYADEQIGKNLLFFAFAPKNSKISDLEKSSDGYTRKYVYDFGTIYCHELTPLKNFSIYKDLGEPLEIKDIFENIYEKLNEKLKPFLEA